MMHAVANVTAVRPTAGPRSRPRALSAKAAAPQSVQMGSSLRMSSRSGAARLGRRSTRTFATEEGDMDVVAEEPAADADAADGFWEKDQIFPRVKERDAYRRLGISDEASFEEVQDARNYLVQTYARHTAGVEAIEEAFDRIIKQKLTARKKTRGLRAAMRKQKAGGEDYTPPFLDRLKAQFERPDDTTLMRRALIYAIMMGWAVVATGNGGQPTFQMFISFALCVYFLKDKRGEAAELGKCFINAFVALAIGFLVGSVFPVYIPVFPPSWGPELVLSLFTMVSLFVFATFLK